ncbi:hypothetical protein, conserved [Eimeria necatrix]|uniref:Uncharacterized protein n=1 Tax=Eimeria necatrix TaxID=51315 RepID=U6N1W1_9EIME|nr:hypothetical protein, conserved [Eimeria necatrix]CDJ70192.1 hypothetical protein, conserved [Eimeria necatrix]
MVRAARRRRRRRAVAPALLWVLGCVCNLAFPRLCVAAADLPETNTLEHLFIPTDSAAATAAETADIFTFQNEFDEEPALFPRDPAAAPAAAALPGGRAAAAALAGRSGAAAAAAGAPVSAAAAAGAGRRARGFSRPRGRSRRSLSLGLLACLALAVSAAAFGRSPLLLLQQQQQQQQAWERRDAALAAALGRLEALRALEPVVSSLAAAVDSPEAQQLLLLYQQQVEAPAAAAAAGEAAAAPELAAAAAEAAAEEALSLLRLLHDAAVQEASLLEASQREFHGCFLETWEEKIIEQVAANQQAEAETGPFVQTLKSLQESEQQLQRQFQLARQQLLQQQEFGDEQQWPLLAAAAADLACMKRAAAARAEAAAAAAEVKRNITETVRALLAARRDKFARQAEGDLDLLDGYMHLLQQQQLLQREGEPRGAPAAAAAAAAAAAEGPEERELALEKAQDLFLNASQLLTLHERSLADLGVAGNLGRLLELATLAAAQEPVIASYLDECWGSLLQLPAPCEALEAAKLQRLAIAASRVGLRSAPYKAQVRSILAEAKGNAAPLRRGCCSSSSSSSSSSSGGGLLSREVTLGALEDLLLRVDDAEALIGALEVGLAAAAERGGPGQQILKDLEHSKKALGALIEASHSLARQIARQRLTGLLEQQVEDIDSRVHAASLLLQQSAAALQLHAQYLRARKELQLAKTLWDAAAAAAAMRSLADTIEFEAYKLQRGGLST